MQMWSHTPAPRRTQRDTNTDGHTRLQMQQDAKQTHTRVWCPSFYSLSLPFSVSRGSRCGHMTHCCCSCRFILCMWGCVSARVHTVCMIVCPFMYNNVYMHIFVCITALCLDTILSSSVLCCSPIRVCDLI